MGAIYHRSKSVSSWLGSWETSELAVTCIKSLASWERTRHEDKVKAPEEEAEVIDWAALQPFFQQPYWSRVWIGQEISFGQNLEILCGNAPELSSEQVMGTIQACERISNNNSADAFLETPEYRHLNQPFQLRSQALCGEPIKLFDLLMRTIAALATEARDKVFGLLGMAYDTSFLLLAPNYANSMGSLSRGVTVAFLSISDPLDFIVFFASADPLTAPHAQTLLHHDKDREESCHDTPSWILNWFQGTTWSDGRKNSYILGKAWFADYKRGSDVHHYLSTTKESKPNFRILNNTFVCRGMILDPGNSIPGDKIPILPSCTFPVVLRPRPAGGFWIIGDVCAQGFTHSGIGTEFTDNWPEVEIY